MTDGRPPRPRAHDVVAEAFDHQAMRLVQHGAAVFHRGDAGSFLATMLQRVQTEEGHLRRFFNIRYADDTTHVL
jgi:hypothetical protein